MSDGAWAGAATDSARIALVTGAAGFIGSELVAQLCASGRRVAVLDNLATGSWDNLAGLPIARRVTADVRDPALVADAMRGVSTVFHLAGLNLRHAIGTPLEVHHVNATGTIVVLQAARRAGVERVVHVSSCDVYGTARVAPMTEDHPTEPTTPFGASKLAGEAYARAFCAAYGLPVVVIRAFHTYGPQSPTAGSSGDVIPRFFTRALSGLPLDVYGDGDQTRDFTHVQDMARGILLAERAPAAVGGTFNLGSGREISITELAERVSRAAGRAAAGITRHEARPGDVRRLVADTTRAREVLGFEPRVTLEDGLAAVAETFAAQAAARRSETPRSPDVRPMQPV